MKGSVHATSERCILEPELKLNFDKEFFLRSKYLLIAMGVASLYCIGYAIILYQEFRKMGIIEMLSESL